MKIHATAIILSALFSGLAHSTPVDFVFTLTKPLMHGADTLGGASSPIIFRYRTDSDAPNLNPSPNNGLYSVSFGSVQVGDTLSTLSGGVLAIGFNFSFSDFLGTANGPDDGSRIEGRSLFVSHFEIFDLSAQMLTKTNLPTDSAFGIGRSGFVDLTFRSLASDVEYATNDYVKYDAFIGPDDYTFEIQPVPIPAAEFSFAGGIVALIFGKLVERNRQ